MLPGGVETVQGMLCSPAHAPRSDRTCNRSLRPVSCKAFWSGSQTWVLFLLEYPKEGEDEALFYANPHAPLAFAD